MQRTKPDKEIVAVDIDIKINSIETSIREIKQLLLGFQTSSYRHVNPETLKGTLQGILSSLQSPLNQISSFLDEVNGPNSKLNPSLQGGFSLPLSIREKKKDDNESGKEKAETARKESEQIRKETEAKAKREAEEKARKEGEEVARRKVEELAKRKSQEEEERALKEARAEAERKRKEDEAAAAAAAEEERRRESEEAEKKRKEEAEAAERTRRELLEAEAAERTRREAEEEERQHKEAEEALADLAKTEEINVDGLGTDFDVSNLNFSSPAETVDDSFASLNAAAKNLGTSSEFGSAAADLLAELEGDNQVPQFESAGDSLNDLSVDGLDFKSSGNETDDLTNALSSLGTSEQKADLMDLLQSLEAPQPTSESKSENATSEEKISIPDNFNFPPPSKKNKSVDARVIKRGARNALKNFNFEDESFEDNFDAPTASLKRKAKKPEASVAVDDLLSSLDNLGAPSNEADLANSLNEFSTISSAKEDLLKSLGDLQFDETTTIPNASEDPIAASLKELEEIQPVTPEWMRMFFAGKEVSQPTDNASKRRSSRIERLTPLPEREVGQLFRGYGVREDINKPGLRRVKKGKGIHASGKPVLQMEDVNIILHPFSSDSNKALFAVFDGHVGKNCANAAKDLWPEEFISQLSSSSNNDASEAFKTTYANVDRRLSEYEYEGTTATTVYLWQDGEDRYLQAANVGDSTAFLCREGEAIWLTKDHKVSDPDEQNRLKQLGPQAWHPGKSRINGLAVSRAMGDFFVKNEGLGLIGEPYVSEVFKIVPGDSILIVASDGLWDVISGQAAMNLIVHLDDAEEMAKTLIRHALNSPKCNDNITIIVVTL